MTNCLRVIVLFVYSLQFYQAKTQGCSDAGFCTIGNFNAQKDNRNFKKQEVDILYTYGAHLGNERFYTPQINYRNISKSGSFWELRIPLNTAKDKTSSISYTGLGDVVATYNSNLKFKKIKIDYSFGFRVSFSRSDKGTGLISATYPMFLQSGLGTTDFLAVLNCNVFKFLSLGTGLQIPIFQYNKNATDLYSNGIYTTTLQNFHRQPDALLKLTGHYILGKFKLNGGFLGIFHLANDYYDHSINSTTKYSLGNSAGTTINADLDISYRISNNLNFSLLYALPLKTRSNTPEGLARSKIISPKLTIAF